MTTPLWTPERLLELKNAWRSPPTQELADRIGLPLLMVRAKAKTLRKGRAITPDLCWWTSDEEQRLRQMYADATPRAVIAKELGRTKVAVTQHAATLGLVRGLARTRR